MATTSKRLILGDINTVLGAIQPDLTRTDNKYLTLNGHPCSVFLVTTVTTAEPAGLQLPTKLVGVRGGVVRNMTTDLPLAIPVIPLSTNASVAVVNGILPADNVFIVVVYGTEHTSN